MDGDGGEKREVRRPMNAFLIFCKRHRAVVREKNPDMDNRSVTRVLGDLWANLGEEKVTYTNLAKQYKDAFMKANPDYKWHSSDRSQGSSNKALSKPTNSRVIKNVAEMSPDGGITPGKLADPENMGGLNLLLMADKETRDGGSLSSSQLTASHPLTTTSQVRATSTSPFSATMRQSNTPDSGPNSALLQLAEMCTSELQGSSKVTGHTRSHSTHHKFPSASASVAPYSLPNSGLPGQQPMPPPKKRARHWSLTEPEDLGKSPHYSDGKNDGVNSSSYSVTLSPLNLSMPKPRCPSAGSAPNYDEKYSSVERYKTSVPRRRLSSSATESIPSPSPPFMDGLDGTDSPVFVPDSGSAEGNFAKSNVQSSEMYDLPKRTIPNASAAVARLCGIATEEAQLSGRASPSSGLLAAAQKQSLFQSLQQMPAVSFHHATSRQKSHASSPHVHSSLSLASTIPTTQTQFLLQQQQPQQISWLLNHQPLPASQSAPHISPGVVLSSESSCIRPNLDIKSEKNNPDFYQWRDPGKSKVKEAGETPPPTSTKPPLTSTSMVDCPNPSLVSILNQANVSQSENKNHLHNFMKYEPMDIRAAPSTTSSVTPKHGANLQSSSSSFAKTENDVKPRFGSAPVPYGKIDFASLLSEGRIASLLSGTDVPSPILSLGNSQRSLSKSNLLQGLKAETNPCEDMAAVQKGEPAKFPELSVPVLKVSSTGQSQTFSEGKLKKKWTERMLVEAKLEQDRHQQQVREGGGSIAVMTTTAATPGSVANRETSVYKNSETNQKSVTSGDKNKVYFDTSKAGDFRAIMPKNPVVSGEFRLNSSNENLNQAGKQKRLILNQPLDAMKASAALTPNSTSFSPSSHPKLMLQLSQRSQPLHRPGDPPPQPQTYFGGVKLNSELDKSGLDGSSRDKALLTLGEHAKTFNNSNSSPGGVSYSDNAHCRNKRSQPHADRMDGQSNNLACNFTATGLSSKNNGARQQDLSSKQILNQISACGKKIMDHIVEQLCKGEVGEDKVREVNTSCSNLSANTRLGKSEQWTEGRSYKSEVKEEVMDRWVKREDGRDFKVMTASSLVERVVREVCGSPPRKDSCNSCRRLDQIGKGNNIVTNTDSPPSSATNSLSLHSEPGSWDAYRQTASSPSNDSQSQWSTLTAESNDQSDHNEDTSVQPVRKSRRANRGQKYQALIKEGFIQPSRERMAARNAERHGRSFGTREEYEKMEQKRTLKRSASERDVPSDCGASPSANANAVHSSADAVIAATSAPGVDSMSEKRFTTGDFDLEKEIESLPVCSLDQLEKKKPCRRRCDSETGLSTPRHRSNSDATTSSSHTSISNSPVKTSPASGSMGKIAANTKDPMLKEACGPALHIPLPVEERPSVPVTGSRKRKARKHCITRISVLENSGVTKDSEKVVNTGPSTEKKFRSQSVDMPSTDKYSSEEEGVEKKSRGFPANTAAGGQAKTQTETSSMSQPVMLKSPSPALTSCRNPQPQMNLSSSSSSSTSSTSSSVPSSLSLSSHQIMAPTSVSSAQCDSSDSQSSSRSSVIPASFITTPVSASAGPVVVSAADTMKNLPQFSSHDLKSQSGISTGGSVSTSSISCSVESTSLVSSSDAAALRKSAAATTRDTCAKNKFIKKRLDSKPRKTTAAKKNSESSLKKRMPKKSSRTGSFCSKKDAAKELSGKSKQVTNPEKELALDSILKPAVSNHPDSSGKKPGSDFKHGDQSSLTSEKTPAQSSPCHKEQGLPASCDFSVSKHSQSQPSHSLTPSPELNINLLNALPVSHIAGSDESKRPAVTTMVPMMLTSSGDSSTATTTTSTTENVLPSFLPQSHSSSKPTPTAFSPAVSSVKKKKITSSSKTSTPPPPQPTMTGTKSSSSSAIQNTLTQKASSSSSGPVSLPVSVSNESTKGTASSNVLSTPKEKFDSSVSVPYACATSQGHSSQPSPLAASASLSSLSAPLTTSSSSTSSALLPCSQSSSLSSSPPPSSSLSTSTATVISLATSSPTSKSDIVSYTVISSSSVMEAGSPHMIGSPHLPESPSVAIVQS